MCGVPEMTLPKRPRLGVPSRRFVTRSEPNIDHKELRFFPGNGVYTRRWVYSLLPDVPPDPGVVGPIAEVTDE